MDGAPPAQHTASAPTMVPTTPPHHQLYYENSTATGDSSTPSFLKLEALLGGLSEGFQPEIANKAIAEEAHR